MSPLAAPCQTDPVGRPPGRTVLLGDVCELITKGTTPTSYGHEFVEKGVNYVKVESISDDGRLLTDTFDHVSPKTHEFLARSQLQAGDVLFTIAGTIGRCAVVDREILPANTNQAVAILRPSRQKVIPRYLRYVLSTPEFAFHAGSRVHQSVQANLNLADLRKAPVLLPDLPTQQRLLGVVSPLDDKIDLNRRMNQTLEETARALFKFWFVDFGPVRAKAEGRWKKGESLPGCLANMWDLWPSEFEETEIGEIPKEWKVVGLGETAICRRELVDPSEIDPEARYVGLEHIAPRSLSLWRWGRVGDTVSGKARFSKGDVLFGKLRPYFHKVCAPSFDGVASTDILTIRPSVPSWFAFVLGHLNTPQLIDHATATSNGTKMPRTSWDDLARWQVALPPQEVADSLTGMTAPMISKMGQAIEESRALSATRDALLPKLLSGEIRVHGGEAQ
ncbi:MAG: restriction endonuclease subunit S [Thermoplasmata archaeon]